MSGKFEPIAGLRKLYVLPPVLWTAFAIYFPLGFINVASQKLYLPLLRSLVVCQTLVTEVDYSGSLHCGDRNLVILEALQHEAWLVGVKLVCRMISGPILGGLCDSLGRKPVLLLSIGGITTAFALMTVACMQTLIAPMVVLTIALVIQGCTTAFGLCFKAIIADSLERDQRARGFVVLNHVDVLSRGVTLVFVIYVQKIQFMRYDLLCGGAALIGLSLIGFCHSCLPETLPQKPAQVETKQSRSLSGLCQDRFKDLSSPFKLLGNSTFLRLRLLQMLLLQLGNGWESVQDSWMISSLGWGPGDWDLVNVPISSFREVWGMVTSGTMVLWVTDPANRFWYIQASLAFGSAMLLIQNFAPWGAAFMLIPRCLLALCPGDGGADQAFFSSQFPREAQASANGLLTAVDNVVSGVSRWFYARFLFDPAARGLSAATPLLARTFFTLVANGLCLYSWWRYGHPSRAEPKKED